MANFLTRILAPIVLLAILAGCNGPVRGLYPPADSNWREIYIVNNHWHAGFVLRRDDMSPELLRLLPRFADAEYLEIGWGDDHFYRSPESTSGLAMQALFFSQGSVLHVMRLDDPPEIQYRDYLVDLYRLRVSPQGEQRLIQFIESSFATDDSGTAIELQGGVEPGSWFYKARGNYSLFHTCNQWCADGLRQTGFPISPFYASMANNVGWQVHTCGAKYQSELLVLHDGAVQTGGR